MKKALFLDRDGVINVEIDYLHKKEDFVFIEGILDLCRYFQTKAYLIIVVTNQSGIARNYYTEEDFQALTTWMIEEFAKHDIRISKVYHCPHHPKITGACSCRKPEPQMLLQAQSEFNLDMQNSLLVGDKERDIEAGLNAGLKETYLFVQNGDKPNTKATKVVSKLENIWKNRC